MNSKEYMLYAMMADDAYIDLAPSYMYQIERVFADGHIKLVGSPRRYEAKSFTLYKDSKKITFAECYRLFKLKVIMERYGV